MNVLKTEELKQIVGGFSFSFGAIISVGVTFLIGLFDGIVRPLRCHS